MKYKTLLIICLILQFLYILQVYLLIDLAHISTKPVTYTQLQNQQQATEIIIRLVVGLYLAIWQWLNFIVLLILVIKLIKSFMHLLQHFINKDSSALIQTIRI